MVKNIYNKKDLEDFKNIFFTQKGYETLTNYLKNLVLLFCKQNLQYPFRMNPVLGIPLFDYAAHITSSDELLGRIKLLGQILGISEISFKIDDKKVVFNMNGNFVIT